MSVAHFAFLPFPLGKVNKKFIHSFIEYKNKVLLLIAILNHGFGVGLLVLRVFDSSDKEWTKRLKYMIQYVLGE